jgi:cytochrome b pre-mRNA-processing protein 3
MRKLGEAFYGRVQGYEKAMAALPDTSAMEALVTRTIYADVDATDAPALAAYIIARREALAAQPLERLYAGDVSW